MRNKDDKEHTRRWKEWPATCFEGLARRICLGTGAVVCPCGCVALGRAVPVSGTFCRLWTRGSFWLASVVCRVHARVPQRVWSNTTGNDGRCRRKTTAKKRKDTSARACLPVNCCVWCFLLMYPPLPSLSLVHVFAVAFPKACGRVTFWH